MAGRRCPARHCPRIISADMRYCTEHARDYEQKRGTRQARGYDATHDHLRAHWQKRINAGEVVLCADGCGIRITGTQWQLGHDHDNGGYLGPQTIAHNAADGGRRGRATQTPT